jgi:hypothetical protein
LLRPGREARRIGVPALGVDVFHLLKNMTGA